VCAPTPSPRTAAPEVLERIDLTVPVPGSGQILVEAAVAGVAFAEIRYRRGGFGVPDGPGRYAVPGLEVAAGSRPPARG